MTNIVTMEETLDTAKSVPESWINKITSCAIVGARDTAKTSLAMHLLSHANKPIFQYGCPQPSLLNRFGIKRLIRLSRLETLKNCFLWIDEPQLSIPVYEKKANDNMLEMLSIALHRNVTILLSSCDTRFFTRGLESYIDVWLVKRINPFLVKQGSLIKKVIKEYTHIDPEGFSLENGEYLFYSYIPEFEELNGRQTFPKNEKLTREILKAY